MTPALLRFLEHCVDAERDGLVRVRAAAFRAEISPKGARDFMARLVQNGCLTAHQKGSVNVYSLTDYGRYRAGAQIQSISSKDACAESIERLLARGEAVMASAPRNKAVRA